jgi:serine phosphatase RsbU (regulator of sigma subunit)/DNA-binding NarL/FixJ family response regulator
MARGRIMVVEDEGVVALQIRESLQGMGYEVPLVALTGEEAVARLLETEPDLVLMDIQLKGALSGIDTAQRIRKRLDVPIVYLTAFSDAETLVQAQLTEPYGYILKPFEEKGLHAIIQMSLLKHSRTHSFRDKGWWMSAVAASMVEAVLICDPKGYVKFINPSTEVLIGKRQPEVLEKRLSELVQLIDAETRAPLPFPVTEPLLEGKSTVRGNCRLVAGEGRELSVEFSASPLRSPEGTLFGILFVFRETAERERIHALVMHEMDELARAQKRTLRARDTRIPGILFDSLCLPTTISGGDALGCFPLDEQHVAFYALDVIGQASLSSHFSMLLQTFLSPHVDEGGLLVEKKWPDPRQRVLSPSEVVQGLSRRFFLKEDARPFFTIAYGVLDPRTGLVRLARAGHPFPLLQKAGGRVHLLKPDGFAVGLFAGPEVAEEELTLEKGDRLILYSDGLVDCTNAAGARFTETQLMDLVKAGRHLPLADLVESLRQKVVTWRGASPLSDDVSLLVLEKE